jgi:cell division protein FtsB
VVGHPIAAWRNSARRFPLRWLLVALLAILVVLQYRLWIAEGSLAERSRLEQQVLDQTEINAQLTARNAVLEREVLELQTGNKGVEQRAREQLGLIRKDETFYQFTDSPQPQPEPVPEPVTEPAGAPAPVAEAAQ